MKQPKPINAESQKRSRALFLMMFAALLIQTLIVYGVIHD